MVITSVEAYSKWRNLFQLAAQSAICHQYQENIIKTIVS